jgi:TolB protein
MDVRTGAQARVTPAAAARRLQLRPQPHPDGEHIVYLHKAGYGDEVRVHRVSDGSDRTLLADGLLTQTRPALSPDGRNVAINRPTHDGTWALMLVELANPSHPVTLLTGLPSRRRGAPMAAGSTSSRATPGGTCGCGACPPPAVRRRTWPSAAGSGASPRARCGSAPAAAGAADAAARLHVTDASGHPMVPQPGQAWFDGQHGRVFFYSPGVIDIVVPAGRATVTAVRGLAAAPVTVTADVVRRRHCRGGAGPRSRLGGTAGGMVLG